MFWRRWKHTFVFSNFSSGNRAVYEIVVLAAYENITRRMRFECWITKATRTLIICNANCFFTATTVIQTLLVFFLLRRGPLRLHFEAPLVRRWRAVCFYARASGWRRHFAVTELILGPNEEFMPPESYQCLVCVVVLRVRVRSAVACSWYHFCSLCRQMLLCTKGFRCSEDATRTSPIAQ
jgi:hypothetical protein